MPTPRTCPNCGLELGPYVETHCPQCGVNLTPKPPVSAGIWLLDLMITVGVVLFVMGCLFGFVFYMNSSSRAQLYQGAPYHATTFRVTRVQYSKAVIMGNKLATSQTFAYAIGIAEGHKETMDLMDYVPKVPTDQDDLMLLVPEGTVIPVYLFPTLQGASRIQPMREVPPAETYQRRTTRVSNRVLPVVGVVGFLTALLSLARALLSRSRRVAN